MDLPSSPFKFVDPRQLRIYQNLAFLGPGPAAFYRDACQLMLYADSFESVTHLVGHCIREIESSVRDVVVPVSGKTSGDIDKSNGDSNAGSSHKEEIRLIIRALGIGEDDQVAQAWLEIPGRLHKLAHRRGLKTTPFSQEFKEIWEGFQIILDVVSVKFRNRFLTVFGRLDALLAKADPTKADARVLKDSFPQNYVTLSYFFDRCSNPKWLSPLKEEGFFDEPPEAEVDNERGTVRFPVWPQSRYLVRTVPDSAKTVLDIIHQIPDARNPRVYEDLLEAASRMPLAELPANSVTELAARAKIWAAEKYTTFSFPERFAVFSIHLAQHGKIREGLEVARVLLEVLPDKSYEGPGDHQPFFRLLPNPRPRLELWHYEEICRKYLPELVSAAGLEVLNLVCHLLESALKLSTAGHEAPPPEDYSTIWRPAIETDDPVHMHDIKNILVSALRDAGKQLARSDRKNIRGIVDSVESRGWWIFRRVALYLLSEFPDCAPEMVAARLASMELLEEIRVRHEYVLLISRHYSALKPQEKQIIQDLIRNGPDLQRFSERELARTGKEPSEVDVTTYQKRWQWERLAWIRVHLVGDLRDRYDSLVREFGEPVLPHSPIHGPTFSWVGPTSPKTDIELREMPVADLTEFLRSWQPSLARMEPSPEGLGRILSLVVKEECEKFAQQARAFKNLDPTYVRAFFSGLEESLKAGSSFSWLPVLELANWVLEQPREIPGRQSDSLDMDPHWGLARKSIASLMGQGFAAIPGAISSESRLSAWEVLLPLTWDVDPTPEDEQRFGVPNMDPATLSINTTRGEAMHAVVQYALWIYRNLKRASEESEKGPPSFDDMPEVRQVLDDHLDPSREPSLAIRAVYGQWFPWLVLLDQRWASEHVDKIFPYDASSRDLRYAAWGTYLIFCHPYDNVLEVLHDQYAIAVDQLREEAVHKWIPGDPKERLAEHLMAFYLRERLALRDPLFDRFWQEAPEKLRGHALEFLGRILRDSDKVPKISHLRELWESRLEIATSSKSSGGQKEELAAFGSWFVSGKFDDTWALEQLLEALKLAGGVHSDHLVAKRLAELSPSHPTKCIQCLRAMVEGDPEGWSILAWSEEARGILQSALESSSAQANEEATGLINYLGSRGYLDFRELL
jgi:hypothetical protein